MEDFIPDTMLKNGLLLLAVNFLLTIASAQEIEWQNTIGGSGYEELRSIQQTSDGGYILAGWSGSNISGDKTENSNGGVDFWIIKTDSLGTLEWQNTIGGVIRIIFFRCITQQMEGTFWAEYHNQTFRVIKQKTALVIGITG
ncbi:MAG: hypothetical protein IPP71_21340 [Bacteroidetes bacterium]|nr:hypothetical protein [Bacteroidota bacterium]